MTTTTTQQLIESAYDALEAEDSSAALEFGKKLLDLKHVRGFEIVALALEQQGKLDDAVSALQTGVSKVPDAYPLWELLGNYLSELSRFKESYEAYQKAVKCQGAQPDSINYNAAIMLRKAGQPEQALQLIDTIKAPEMRLRAEALKTSLLNNLKRHDEAGQLANALIGEITGMGELSDEDMADLATCYAELARAAWQGHRDSNTAWDGAFRALEWDRSEVSALWLIRELINRRSEASHWFRLEITGQWHFPLEPGQPPPAFATTYDVVADTTADALIFAQHLEPPEIRESLKVGAVEDRGPCADHLQGVYWRGPYEFS